MTFCNFPCPGRPVHCIFGSQNPGQKPAKKLIKMLTNNLVKILEHFLRPDDFRRKKDFTYSIKEKCPYLYEKWYRLQAAREASDVGPFWTLFPLGFGPLFGLRPPRTASRGPRPPTEGPRPPTEAQREAQDRQDRSQERPRTANIGPKSGQRPQT